MTLAAGGRGQSKSLVLTAMFFAFAMTFIDQTIASIAAPTVQHDLGLSSSGMQWGINAYLLALAALYGQIALAEKATTASLLILYFFLGFVAAVVAFLGLRGGVQQATAPDTATADPAASVVPGIAELPRCGPVN